MLSVTKSFSWSMAHRLGHGYRGKCAALHGHNYRAEVTVAGRLDAYGMVVDFDVIKQGAQAWVMEHLDHGVVIAAHDTELLAWAQQYLQKHYLLPAVYANSTAEVLAQLLASVVPLGFPIQRVRVYETADCWAEWNAE